MTQQINLYNPALRRERNLLSALNVAAVAGVLLVSVGAAAAWSSIAAARARAEATVAAEQLTQATARLTVVTHQLASAKPSPALAAELATAQALLKGRQEVLALLDGGVVGSTTGFAEHLRGLARQVPTGLWLTAFTIGPNGADIEIRGRATTAALLPDYIRRLNSEKAFQGRSFAALDVSRPAPKPAPTAPAGAGKALPAEPAPYLEFALLSTESESAKSGAGGAKP